MEPQKTESTTPEEKSPKKKLTMGSFLIAFLMPTLFGKSLIMYFGSYYSTYPGEGYGWGLVGSICFTLIMVFRFLWKFRDYED